jgi:nucleoside-diphosphate-sugar epimerase
MSPHTDDSLVVVFGGAGYIGSHLVQQLLAEDYHVRVVDNFLFGDDGLKNIDSQNLEVIRADVCDTRAVSSACKGAETVVLLAAIVGHRIEDIRWNNTREINFLGSNVVLDAAIEHGAQRFFFASTNSVYGTQTGVMYETGIPEPVSLYSRLKLRMEEKVISAKKRSFHPTVLRLGTCHGVSPRMRFDLVANTIIRDAVCRGEIVVENGERWRALIHVKDAAKAFVACLQAHINMTSGEIFNVGNPEQNIQVNHLVNIAKKLVPGVTVEFLDSSPELGGYRLSSSKIGKSLDFIPTLDIEESMREMCEMLQSGHWSDPYSIKYCNT